MKKLLLIVLGIHIVLETLVGGILALSPNTVMPDATGTELSGLVVQGMCALAMVVLAIWLLFYRDQLPALSVGLGTLASFHSLIIVSLALTMPAADQLVGYTHHLLLAVAFWFLWARRNTMASV